AATRLISCASRMGNRICSRRSCKAAFRSRATTPSRSGFTASFARRVTEQPEEERMADSSISILEGNTFVVSDRRGDVDASPTDTHGLFYNDTRFLSRWILTVDGQRPNVLSVDSLNYFATQFFLVPGTGTVYVDSPLSIVRQRAVG